MEGENMEGENMEGDDGRKKNNGHLQQSEGGVGK